MIELAIDQERERISRFHFVRDSKLALVGRLMLKAAACLILQPQPGEEVTFLRTPEGKPYLSPSSCVAPLPSEGPARPSPGCDATTGTTGLRSKQRSPRPPRTADADRRPPAHRGAPQRRPAARTGGRG